MTVHGHLKIKRKVVMAPGKYRKPTKNEKLDDDSILDCTEVGCNGVVEVSSWMIRRDGKLTSYAMSDNDNKQRVGQRGEYVGYTQRKKKRCTEKGSIPLVRKGKGKWYLAWNGHTSQK